MIKKVIFEGNTLETIRQLPNDARHRTGYEIDCVQRDKEPDNWKPFPAIGQGVREIRIPVDRRSTGLSILLNLMTRCMSCMCLKRNRRKPASRISKLQRTDLKK